MHRILSASLLAIFLAAPAMADGITISDSYARAATPTAKSGAIFLTAVNETDQDDRLVAASTDAAALVQLHSHSEDANGVMRMGEVEGGFPLPAGETLTLERGGNHVMLMGLNGPLTEGAEVTLTLTFEVAGDITVTVPVDLAR